MAQRTPTARGPKTWPAEVPRAPGARGGASSAAGQRRGAAAGGKLGAVVTGGHKLGIQTQGGGGAEGKEGEEGEVERTEGLVVEILSGVPFFFWGGGGVCFGRGGDFGAFCLDVRPLTFCQLMGFA